VSERACEHPDVVQDRARLPAGLLLEQLKPESERSDDYWKYMIEQIDGTLVGR
jgi:hypothetical protein